MATTEGHVDGPDSLGEKRPASCLSCKARKLRCNRQFPCSNCTTRNISCQQPGPRTRRAKVRRANPQPNPANSEIIQRLCRLEHLLVERHNSESALCTPSSLLPATAADNLQSFQSIPATTLHIQDLEDEALRLEKTCKAQSSLACIPFPLPSTVAKQREFQGSALSDGLIFRVCPLAQLTSPITYIFQPSVSSFGIVDPVKCIWIPTQAETRIILAKFIQEIDYIRHIVHTPSLQCTIDSLYTQPDMCKNVATGPLALLLSIIATVSHQWPHDDPGHKALFATSADSKHRTIAWAKAALDVIDYSARVASRSIEHVQALLHICYVLFHLDGFSTQLGSVFGTTVTYARSLGLHIIDLPRSMDGTSNPHPGGLAAEMGRRVWWSVVTLDWLLAQRCYPLGGFDLMNPTLTAVNLPRDCNDDEIEGNVPSIQGPSSMTFHILKIKLVEVCRDFSAGGSSSPAVPSETIYSGVMRSDAKLNTFIRELPPAFQLNHDASITESQRTRSSRPPRVLTAQCYMLNLSIQAQLCKLHLPYLFRAAVDPAVTYSRQACLRAAQQVIRIECVLENKTEPPFLHGLFHHRGVLYILSLACIVLLLDSCLVSAAGSNTAPSRETSEAYRLLEDASKYSPTSETLFNALVQLLMRHRVSLPVHMTIVGTETRACEADVVDTVSGMDTMKDGDVCTALAGFQGGLWDELWPSEANGVGVGGLDWKDTLLAEIDLSFM